MATMPPNRTIPAAMTYLIYLIYGGRENRVSINSTMARSPISQSTKKTSKSMRQARSMKMLMIMSQIALTITARIFFFIGLILSLEFGKLDFSELYAGFDIIAVI